MKKITILSVIGATLAALASCTTAPTTDATPTPNQGQVPITFASNTLEVSTRALVAKDSYAVLAIIEYLEPRTFTEKRYVKEENGDIVLKDVEVIDSKYGWYFTDIYANGKPKSGNTYFWPEDGSKLHFFAFWSSYLGICDVDMAMVMSRADDGGTSEKHIKDLANIDKYWSAETIYTDMDKGDYMYYGAYLPSHGQDDLLIAEPQLDQEHSGNSAPQPVKLTFSHATAKVNIKVRLDDKLAETYQINDDYAGFMAVSTSYYQISPFATGLDKQIVPLIGTGGCNYFDYQSYNILPQSTIATEENPLGIGIGITDLNITKKDGSAALDDKFTGAVLPYSLQPGDVKNDELLPGVEYTFTMVLHSLDLDDKGNIPFERNIITIEATTKDWVEYEEGEQEFDQDYNGENNGGGDLPGLLG